MGQYAKHRSLVIRRASLFVLTALAAQLLASGAQAACRLALLLAMDVSSSVSEEEYKLQQTGLAAALLSEDVMGAILDTREGHVALAVYEWSGRYQQNQIVQWRVLDSPAAVQDAAARIAQSTRRFSRFPTAMGFSLGYGAALLKKAPACDRQVIDVSGDGINNDGFGPQLAYRHFPFEDVTVNGLVIAGSDPDVEWYYESEVLHGAQSFLEVAQGFEDFERTMARKLYREISNLMFARAPSARPAPRPSKS